MKWLQKKSTVKIDPVKGSVSDTLNVTDKVTNAPSIRLTQEMITEALQNVSVGIPVNPADTTNLSAWIETN